MTNPTTLILALVAGLSFTACNQKSSGTSRKTPSKTTVDCSVPNPPAECNTSNTGTTGSGDQTTTTTGSGDQTTTPVITCQGQSTQAACSLVSGCSWNGSACVTASTTTPTTPSTPTFCTPLTSQAECAAAPGCSWDGSSCKISGMNAAPQPKSCSTLTTEAKCSAGMSCAWNGTNCTRPGVGLGIAFEKTDGLSVVGNTNNTLLNCNFSALFNSDGNFVVYQGTIPIWSTNTAGKGATRAQFQSDGNFVVAAGTTVLFNTATNGKAANGFVLGKNGNLAILNTAGSVIWQSGTIINGCY